MDLGTIWASVGLKTGPLEAGVLKAKASMTGLDTSLNTGIAGGAKKAESGLASLGAKMSAASGFGGKLSTAIGGVGASLGTLGKVGLGVAVVVGLGLALASCAKAAEEEEKINAQTNAVIASTGGVANVTAAHVDKLGNSLASMTGISHDSIKSMENILLTFRGIKNVGTDKIFDQAVTSTLDLSVAMGRDLSKSAIMVGKALQDPVRGLTAMRRVGVQFTGSQEEMIKSMVATGNTIGAQKIIIAELNAEFGKSAKAYGETYAGQVGKAADQFDRLKESVGKFVLPVATTLLKDLADVAGFLDKIYAKTKDEDKATMGWLGQMKTTKIIPITPIINKSGMIDFGGIIEKITGKFGSLRSMMDSTFAEMSQSTKDLADTLGAWGLKGVADSEIKDMLDSLTSAQPRVRKEGNDMMKQLVDSVAMSDPIIKENASKIGDDISMALEQALEVGPVTDQKMAEIALSVIKSYAPTSAAAQTLMNTLQGIINGTPLVITPEVKIDKFKTPTDMFKDIMSGQTADVEAKINVDTAQASQNVTGLKANISEVKDKGVTASTETAQASQNVTGLRNNIAGLQNKTITLTVVTNEVKTKVSPERSWSSAFAAGEYVAGEIGAGMKANAPTVSAMVSGGIGSASAALTSTFGSFISEMNAAPILEVENAINALTTADWGLIKVQQEGDRAFNTRQKQLEQQALTAEINGNKDEAERVRGAAAAEAKVHDLDMINRELNAVNKTNEQSIAIWRNSNAAVKAATAGLNYYKNAIKSHEDSIASLERTLAGLEAQTAKYNSEIEKLDESTKPYEQQIDALDDQTKAYEKQIRDLDDQTAAYDKQIRDLGDTTKVYERQSRDLDDQLKVLDKSMQDSETRASGYQETLDKFSSMKLAGEGAASDESFAQDEESKKLQLEIMKAEDAHNYALAAKLTLEKEALDRKKEEADLQTSITYDPQHREIEELLDPLHDQEATQEEIVAQITAAQAGLEAEKAIQEALKLQQEAIRAEQERIALLERGIADTVEEIELKKRDIADQEEIIRGKERDIADQQEIVRAQIQLIVDQEELLRDKVEKIEDKQEGIRAKIAAQEKAVAKLNKEYDKAKAKIDKFKKQIDDLASFFISKYGDMKNAVTSLNNAIGGASGGSSGTSAGSSVRVASLAAPSTMSATVIVPLYLDGKVIAKSVTKIQGGNASAYAMSGGHY